MQLPLLSRDHYLAIKSCQQSILDVSTLPPISICQAHSLPGWSTTHRAGPHTLIVLA